MKILRIEALNQLLAMALTISILSLQQMVITQSIAASEQFATKTTAPNPKKVVEAVLQLIETKYIDSILISGKDWQSIRNRYLNRSYQSTEEAYAAIREMLKVLKDPYTRFLDPKEFKDLQTDSSSEKVGIGLQITINEITKQVTVIAPIEDSPAQKAGIYARDILLKIDGQSTQGMSVNEVSTRLRGKAGTSVVVTVQRDQQVLDISVVRAFVAINPVRWSSQNSPVGKVGYIRLSLFSSQAKGEVQKAINLLEGQSVVGYIMDVRSNSGGLLNSGLDITRLWLNNSSIATFIAREGKPKREEAKQTALTQKPLVVLVNGGSAGASEILAGALQENQRAKLVGDRTFGQNTVQSIHSLPDGSALAVTVSKWLTPKGFDISGKGLIPDVNRPISKKELKMLSTNRDLIGTAADPQYAKAIEILNQLIQQSNIPNSWSFRLFSKSALE
jgi:carboxyl-terminal processing protease